MGGGAGNAIGALVGGFSQGLAHTQERAIKDAYINEQTKLLKAQAKADEARENMALQAEAAGDRELATLYRMGASPADITKFDEFRWKRKALQDLQGGWAGGVTGATLPAPMQPYSPGAQPGPYLPGGAPPIAPPQQPSVPVSSGPQVRPGWNQRHLRNILEKELFNYTRQPTQVLRNQLRPGYTGPVSVVLDPESGEELSITPEFDTQDGTMTFPLRGRMVTGTYVRKKGTTDPVAGFESLPDGTQIPKDFVVTDIKPIPTRDVSDETGTYIVGYNPMNPEEELYRVLKGAPEMTEVPTPGGGMRKVPTMSLVPRAGAAAPGRPAVAGGGPGFRTKLDVEDTPVGDKAPDWRIGEEMPPPGMTPRQIREAGGKQVTTGYQGKEAAFRGAEGIVSQLKALGYRVFKKSSPLASWIKTPMNVMNLMMDRDVQMYESYRAGVISNIVRTFGEVGTLNEGDIQRAKSLLPTVMPRIVNGVPIPPDDLDSFEQKMTGIDQLISEISRRPTPSTPNRPEAVMQKAVREGFVGPGPYRNKKTGQTVQVETVDQFMELIGGGK